jgi:hypothetical protein
MGLEICKTNNMKSILFLLFAVTVARAQLAVTVSPVRVTGQKAIVPLVMKNTFADKIESARAACFLLDEKGKMVGQGTRWVVGGTKDRPGLAAGATNTFQFVIAADKAFTKHKLDGKDDVQPCGLGRRQAGGREQRREREICDTMSFDLGGRGRQFDPSSVLDISGRSCFGNPRVRDEVQHKPQCKNALTVAWIMPTMRSPAPRVARR